MSDPTVICRQPMFAIQWSVLARPATSVHRLGLAFGVLLLLGAGAAEVTAVDAVTIHMQAGQTLNEVVGEISEQGDLHIVLPLGVTHYTGPIHVEDRTVVIEGQGINASTLMADGAPRLLEHRSTGDTLHSLTLRGFTLDMAHKTGDGLAVLFVGGHTLSVRQVRIQNMDISERGEGKLGLLHLLASSDDGLCAERLEMIDCEIRFDTLSGRAGGGSRAKSWVVQFLRGVRQFYAERNHLVGERVRVSDRPKKNLLNGFVGSIAPAGIGVVRDNLIERWDQYATNIGAREAASLYVVDNTLPKAGNGDMIRVQALDGSIVRVTGNAIIGEETLPDGKYFGADRGIISKNYGKPASVHITDNHIELMAVPIQVKVAGRNVLIANNTIRNSGHPAGEGERPAIYIDAEPDARMRSVRIAGNIIDNTESPRNMTFAWLYGKTLSGYIVVENNIADGVLGVTLEDSIIRKLSGSDVEVIVRDNVFTPGTWRKSDSGDTVEG